MAPSPPLSTSASGPGAAQATRLPAPLRILFVFANLLLGLLPSLAFFAWVERNASLPWVGVQLNWPWIALQSWPVAALAAWDCALFLAFGLLHSLTAQSRFQKILRAWVPIQVVRTIYLILTGLSLLGVMGLWQNTGIVIWLLPLGTKAVNALSLGLFWSLLAVSGLIMSRFDLLEFVGLKQLYSRAQTQRSEGVPHLQATGIYAWVRHPIYTLTTLAFVLTPFLTLDRTLLIASMALYLTFAIPMEERKLMALFGQTYEEYRQKVGYGILTPFLFT